MNSIRKKRVCFVIHTLSGGGAERILVNTVNKLNKDLYDITVFCIVDTGILRWDLSSDIKYKSLFNNPFRNEIKEKEYNNFSGHLLSNKNLLKSFFIKIYILFWKLFPIGIINKIFIGNNFDITISFLEGISSKFVSYTKGKKYSWIHVDLLKERKSENIFMSFNSEQGTYQKFDKIICVSKEVSDSVIKKYNIDKNKIEIIYNNIDVKNIIDKSREFSFPNEKNYFSIVSVGRLTKQKGFDRLIKVANSLKKCNYKFKIDIYGEGPDKDNLFKLIKYLDLEKYVFLKGFVKNPYPYILGADLFVCSSRAEGYSTVITESLILGTPVVSTLCAGVKEQLSNNEGLIACNNEEDLFKKIKMVMDDTNLYKYIKKNALNHKLLFAKYDSIKKIEEIL